MTLYNRTAILPQDETDWLHLPPFSLKVAPKPLINRKTWPVPKNTATLGYEEINRQYGWSLDLQGRYKELSPEAGLVWQDGLRNYLRDTSTGEARKVDLCVWADSEATIKRIYRDCKLSADPDFQYDDSYTDARMNYSLSLQTPNLTTYATGTGGTYPDESPYETYLHTPSIPPGGIVTGPGITVVNGNQESFITAFFGTIVATTSGSNVLTHQKKITISTTAAYTVKSIQIIGCANSADTFGAVSGSTTIVASKGDYNDGLDSLSASVAYNATQSAIVNNTPFTVSANSFLYVYITAVPSGGGHAFPELRIVVEPV